MSRRKSDLYSSPRSGNSLTSAAQVRKQSESLAILKRRASSHDQQPFSITDSPTTSSFSKTSNLANALKKSPNNQLHLSLTINDDDEANHREDSPLLLSPFRFPPNSSPHPLASNYSSPSTSINAKSLLLYLGNYLSSTFLSLPAVFLGLMLNLLDAMSYGIIIFPASDANIPETGPYMGISMFLVSTVISQLVFSLGGSSFKGVNGSMMIEVMPFLHLMVNKIEYVLKHKGVNDQNTIMATILLSYAASTILTGVLFFLLGYFKLGTVIQFFPRHILIGCIGGIGLFLFVTGIEVSAGLVPNLSNIHLLFEIDKFILWATALSLAIFLRLLQKRIVFPLLVPLFYVVVPALFYIIVWGILDVSTEELKHQGWIFDLPQSSEAPFYTFWTYYDITLVDWEAFFSCVPTMLALVFFGILHVPINVPALSVSTNQEVDTNKEILGHGFSNFLAGLCGTCQNYLVYTNSVLYFRSGGKSKTSGVLLALATTAALVWGGKFIAYIPTIIVGSLIFHLAIDLVKEAIYDTWNVGMSFLEYFTILAIVFVMGFVGFTEGIVAGIVMACIFFVLMYSRRSIIRATYTGRSIRSTVHRLYRQQKYLDACGDQIYILKLQGFMFFGTIHQLDSHIRDLLSTGGNKIKFLVLDFGLISGVDFSATEAFLKFKNIVRDLRIHFVFCGLSGNARELVVRSGIFSNDDDITFDDEGSPNRVVHDFEKLNEALEFCENALLSTYYEKMHTSEPISLNHLEDDTNSHRMCPETMGAAYTPRERQKRTAATRILNYDLKTLNSTGLDSGNATSPISILIEAFEEMAYGGNESYDDLLQTRMPPDSINPSTAMGSGSPRLRNRSDTIKSRISRISISNPNDEEKSEIEANIQYYKQEDFQNLSVYFQHLHVSRGTELYNEGDAAESLYIVETGELELLMADRQTYRVVETLMRGAMIGELELLAKRPRVSKLVASEDCSLWEMNSEHLDTLMEQSPLLALKFIRLALTFDQMRFKGLLSHIYNT